MQDVLTPIYGRSFVTGRNNVAKMQKIGEGAVRAFWDRQPTDSDRDELGKWIQSLTGPLALTHSIGLKNEANHYAEWKKAAAPPEAQGAVLTQNVWKCQACGYSNHQSRCRVCGEERVKK